MFGGAVCTSSSRGNFLDSLPPALTQAASTQNCPHEGTLKYVQRYRSWAGSESSSGTQRELVFSPPLSFPCELFIPLWTASLLDPISFWINFHPYNCPPWLDVLHKLSVSSWEELYVPPLSLSAVGYQLWSKLVNGKKCCTRDIFHPNLLRHVSLPTFSPSYWTMCQMVLGWTELFGNPEKGKGVGNAFSLDVCVHSYRPVALNFASSPSM